MKFVALVRGVGGATAMRMPALADALREAGLGTVVTLQVAGNVVLTPEEFRGVGADCDSVAAAVRSTIRKAFGHDLPVMVRDHDELRDALMRNPYLGTQEGRWIATAFLDRVPDPERVAATVQAADRVRGEDALTIDGREVFVRYAGGVAGSKLQMTWVERQLGVVGTARNANTVEKLVALSAR